MTKPYGITLDPALINKVGALFRKIILAVTILRTYPWVRNMKSRGSQCFHACQPRECLA